MTCMYMRNLPWGTQADLVLVYAAVFEPPSILIWPHTCRPKETLYVVKAMT